PFALSKVVVSVWFKCLSLLSDAWQGCCTGLFPCLRANLGNIARLRPRQRSACRRVLCSFGGPASVAALDDLFRDVRGDLLVLLELHRVRGTSLGRGSQIGRVAEHFAQRDEGLDRQGIAALVLSLHLAAPSRKVA